MKTALPISCLFLGSVLAGAFAFALPVDLMKVPVFPRLKIT